MKEIINILNILGFKPKDGFSRIYFKKYKNFNKEFTINISENSNGEIDKVNSKINYKDLGIKVIRETTSNLSQNESLVILECVDRLLEKGYLPENIVLEKDWGLGHKTKGNLDIEVVKNNKAIFLIECKTWGTEFETEKNKMLRNGGQLFTYLQQEQDVLAICLYTSKVDNNKIEYQNLIVENSEKWKGLNQDERFTYWNKEFKDNGIFEKYVPLFKLESRAIRHNTLKILDKDIGNKIYLNFLEILRHNSVSDKPNAFNKMMNLFLCKITDEQSEDDQESDFQIKSDDKDEDILIRLNNLYNRGMKEFLGIEILDIDSNKIAEIINNIRDENTKNEAKNQFEYLRIKKSQEFNFIDIATDQDFKENTSILREIITILQDYKLRYTQKHQFLGDFFEKLLNDSLKQESGQFFTPIPICEFIINSLPLTNIIYNKINNEDRNFLPYSIDFACGTGHFLTELMEKIQNNINNINNTNLKTSFQKQNLSVYKSGYNGWAKEFIYGIDKDKRLVKATKISCFLNGDGDANIIAGDGLDNFYYSTTYKDKLHLNSNKQDNENFDILISNPPYSVNAFRNYIKNNSNSFNLFSYLTDNSKEIEALFIERMKQLLKINGIAGIILPTSLLTNSGIHEKAREIILQNFKIISFVDLGKNAFMATDTKTTILFLQKKENISKNIINNIEQFFNTKQDITSNCIENVFSKYCDLVYNLELKDYLSILNLNPTEKAKEHDIYKEYIKLFNEEFEKEKQKNLNKLEYLENKIKKIEKEKLLYFILSYNQKVVIGKSGEKKTEKTFYGYEFSDSKEKQGINIYRDSKNKIISKMFNENDLYDTNKLNSYILRNFNNEDLKLEIKNIKENKDHDLNNHINYCNLWQMMNFENSTFNKSIRINNIKNENNDKKSKWGLARLSDICIIEKGITYDKNTDISNIKSNIKILTADNILLNGKIKLDTNKEIYLKNSFKIKDSKKLEKDNIIICMSSGSKKHVGKVAYANIDYYNIYVGGFLSIIKTINKDLIYNMKYLFIYLNSSLYKKNLENISTGSNINNLSNTILDTKIPLPPKEIQEKIVNEIENINKQKEEKENKIEELNAEIGKIIFINENTAKDLFENIIVKINGIKIPTSKFNKKGNTPIISQDTEFINGYIDIEESKRIGDIPVILFGDHNCIFKYIDFPFVKGADGTVVFKGKKEIIITKYLYYLCKNLNIPEKNIYKRHYGQYLSKMYINYIADIKEQQQIVFKIEAIEKEIEKIKSEVENLDKEKEDVLNKYLYV